MLCIWQATEITSRRAIAVGSTQAHQSSECAPCTLWPEHPGDFPNASTDRLGLREGPVARPYDPVIQPLEPRYLQELAARRIEDKRSHAEAKKFCKHERYNSANPVSGGDEIDLQKFHRQYDKQRNNEDNQSNIWGQILNPPRNRDLDPAPRNEVDGARDDGLEVVPQPGLQEQQQREDDPQWTECIAAHESNYRLADRLK